MWSSSSRGFCEVIEGANGCGQVGEEGCGQGRGEGCGHVGVRGVV